MRLLAAVLGDNTNRSKKKGKNSLKEINVSQKKWEKHQKCQTKIYKHVQILSSPSSTSAFPICLPPIWQNVKRRARREHHSSPTPVPCWFGAKRCHRGVEGRRWWCFSDWICILRMRDFFCSNRTLSVLLFGFCLCMITIKWEPLGLIERESLFVQLYAYLHNAI